MPGREDGYPAAVVVVPPPAALNFLRTAADMFCTEAAEVVLLTMVCSVRWKVTTVLTGAPDEFRENE